MPCGPDENSNPSFREFAIFSHDTVPTLQYGEAINYRNANPVGANTGIGGTLRDPFDNQAFQEFSAKGRSAAPIFEAFAGDRVRIRFLQPAFEDHHAFHLNGNRWARENNNPGSNIISTINTGVGTAFNIELDGCWRGRPGGKQLLSGECEDGGAGGPFAKEYITQTTDFIFHCHIKCTHRSSFEYEATRVASASKLRTGGCNTLARSGTPAHCWGPLLVEAVQQRFPEGVKLAPECPHGTVAVRVNLKNGQNWKVGPEWKGTASLSP